MADHQWEVQGILCSCKAPIVNSDKGTESICDIYISNYTDRILVVATEVGTLATILFAQKEESSGGITYNVQTLLGRRDEPLLSACARQLIEKLCNKGVSRPLVLSLGLNSPPSQAQLKKIIDIVLTCPLLGS